MKTRSNSPWLLCLVTLLLWRVGTPARAGEMDTSTIAKALFKKPPREYSTGPLWVWNDLLTEAEIRDTLRDLAG